MLGPDGLRSDPTTIGKLKTFQTEGAHRLCIGRRSSACPSTVRSPSPSVGRTSSGRAWSRRVLVKKRPVKYESDREDVVRPLSYVDDPLHLVDGMSRKEPRWLRDAEAAIDFDDPDLAAQFPAERLGRARQALRILAQESYSASSTK